MMLFCSWPCCRVAKREQTEDNRAGDRAGSDHNHGHGHDHDNDNDDDDDDDNDIAMMTMMMWRRILFSFLSVTYLTV